MGEHDGCCCGGKEKEGEEMDSPLGAAAAAAARAAAAERERHRLPTHPRFCLSYVRACENVSVS